MSMYLELPEFDQGFPFRAFSNDGLVIVYPHWHKEIEIIYSLKGAINIGLGEEVISVKEGEIFYFASGEPHYFLASPESERLVFQFNLSIFSETKLVQDHELSVKELFHRGEHHSKQWPKALTEEISGILLAIFHEYQGAAFGKNFRLMSQLYQLVASFYQQLPLSKQPLKPATKLPDQAVLERLNQVFEYVEEHYLEIITLEEIAKYVGFSPYYFTRFFKKNTGTTFINFLTEYRVNQAKFILANEKIPMVEVAEKAGFTSVKTFHHVFKEVVGQSPLKYQQHIQRKIENIE